MNRFHFLAVALLSTLTIFPVNAQPSFDTPLYGAAYYCEYTPTDRLEEDILLMKEAGLTVVRVGESTWSLFEPQDGHFEFDWMDRILDRMYEAGIKVILGTPTYSIPAWMAAEHPEVMAHTWHGEDRKYGIRQNMDFYNPVYRSYCERIIRRMMEHFAKHPAVIGYQVDNELEARAGISLLLRPMPRERDGAVREYIFNYSSEAREIDYPFTGGKSLLGGGRIKQHSKINIEPWGVVIVEE